MGKEGELWDDSALINAFDDAMSKYKKMHVKKTKDNSTNEEKVSPSVTDESNAVRYAEENDNVASNTSMYSGETKNLLPVQSDHYFDSADPEPCADSSSGQHKQAVNDPSYSQNIEGYNQLLIQYYELEEKRQRILYQLQQIGGYDYQASAEGFGSSLQLGTCFTSQDHSVSTSLCSCCPYAYHCSAAPCTSFPSCSLGQTCACKLCANPSTLICQAKSIKDGDIVKTAMGAAEKAILSMKEVASTNSSAEEKENGKDNAEESAQSMSSETDLSVVLNAWFSAGFYTGKYLTEQSVMKRCK